MNRKKIRVGVLFGGRSAEHEVSLLSAKNVLRAIDPTRYEVVLVGIDKQGRWRVYDASNYLQHQDDPKLIQLSSGMQRVALDSKELFSLENHSGAIPVDVIFPVLHGTFGEDGTMQGLLKVCDVPFVGAGVLGSAIGMDKEVSKRLLRDAGVKIARFICLQRAEWGRHSYEEAVELLGSTLFVKPSGAGSSVGVTKVKNKEEFEKAIQHAFEYDRKVLIEEEIIGREIECGVIGNEHPIVSIPGEIFHRFEFYSYEAKYIDSEGTVCEIPARLHPDQLTAIQQTSLKAYQALCCEGMARVDSFLTPAGEVIVNEINTIPGFTYMSPFPRLWEATGVPFPDLVDRLIQYALDRHEKEKKLKTHYEAEDSLLLSAPSSDASL